MLEIYDIEVLIADAVTLATGIPSIIANQSAPRPDGTYATVFISPEEPTGYDEISYVDSELELDETISGLRKVTASINFFRDGAKGGASLFKNKLQSNKLIEFFKVNNLGFVGTSPIRDLSEVNKEFWEERAQLDLIFHALSVSTEEVLATKEINIDGITESGENDYNVNINVRSQ